MLFRLSCMARKRGLIGVEQLYADDSGDFKYCADPAFRITFLNTLQQSPGNTCPVRRFLGSEPALFTCGADQFAQQAGCRAAVT